MEKKTLIEFQNRRFAEALSDDDLEHPIETVKSYYSEKYEIVC